MQLTIIQIIIIIITIVIVVIRAANEGTPTLTELLYTALYYTSSTILYYTIR